MDNTENTTMEQKQALAKLFFTTNKIINEGVAAILGNKADVVVAIHMHHEDEEPCRGAVVMSNSDDMEVTQMVLTHGMATISVHLEGGMNGSADEAEDTPAEGDNIPPTKH